MVCFFLYLSLLSSRTVGTGRRRDQQIKHVQHKRVSQVQWALLYVCLMCSLLYYVGVRCCVVMFVVSVDGREIMHTGNGLNNTLKQLKHTKTH